MGDADEVLEQKLAGLVGDLLGVPAGKITDDTALDIPRLRSSAGAAILAAAVKAAVGKNISTAGVRTFGQLRAAALGQGAPPARAAGTPSPIATIPVHTAAVAAPSQVACGVDIEDVATLPVAEDYWQHEFYRANFTAEEIAYCVSQAEPRQHFAARWCAKEALKKCSAVFMRLAFSQIRVVNRGDGAIEVEICDGASWTPSGCQASLSHTPTTAIAMAVLASGVAPAAAPDQPPAAQTEAPPGAGRGARSAGKTSLFDRFFR